MIVDDAPENLLLLGELLQPQYRVRAINSGERALRAMHSSPLPDIVLLDVMMPELDGFEVMRRLKSDQLTAEIPVIFITALTGTEDEEFGFDLGAVDYITKPFNPATVLARVHTHIELKLARDRLENQNHWLEKEVDRRMRETYLVRDLSVRALACLAEERDNETGLHIVRTQAYVRILAHHLKDHPHFRHALAGRRLEEIVKAAPLHDIGKVGIPDAILRKPGKLTAEEFDIMKTHAEIGGKAIDHAIGAAIAAADDESVEMATYAFSFLHVAREIAVGHHEKWDGSGYPAGLAGQAIPVSARLMALADVFDALVCRRVYKEPMGLEKATAIICEGRGTHFDPDIVDAFLACGQQFKEVSERFCDQLSQAQMATG